MDTILTLVNKGNDFLWSFLLLILLCGTGIYYTIRLKFIQVRKFGEGCKHVFGHFSLNGEKHEKNHFSTSLRTDDCCGYGYPRYRDHFLYFPEGSRDLQPYRR